MTVFDVEVRAQIPVAQFKVLHKTAAAYNLTVAALVAELVRRGLQPTETKVVVKRRARSTAADLNELVKLHGLGYSDGEIAARIGWSAKWVQEKRKRLRLAPQGVRGRPRKAS